MNTTTTPTAVLIPVIADLVAHLDTLECVRALAIELLGTDDIEVKRIDQVVIAGKCYPEYEFFRCRIVGTEERYYGEDGGLRERMQELGAQPVDPPESWLS